MSKSSSCDNCSSNDKTKSSMCGINVFCWQALVAKEEQADTENMFRSLETTSKGKEYSENGWLVKIDKDKQKPSSANYVIKLYRSPPQICFSIQDFNCRLVDSHQKTK
ncbi:hypothetical protein RFI_39442 [Reticulomyxa filosa]|uniref:Uncharacterized protein n=1 Tax=Reticulomyxa filosa TaxID=46433 RepID=X6L971_RETFI|nr:hypothetical protein RFI_39442 [Reticulomyxa filosa]|eukprot:ETN98078.1 hypothetical protein RFI_39442 [Reticulomyxa filosa]